MTDIPAFLQGELWAQPNGPRTHVEPVKVLSAEKLLAVIDLFTEAIKLDPHFKLLTWSAFRYEAEALVRRFKTLFEVWGIGEQYAQLIVGNQNKSTRDDVLRLLHPKTAPCGPVFVAGIYGTGAEGLNFTAAHNVVNVSLTRSLNKYQQSADRVHRPGQTEAVNYHMLIATGPSGQKTIDHVVAKALKNREELADFTMARWVQELT